MTLGTVCWHYIVHYCRFPNIIRHSKNGSHGDAMHYEIRLVIRPSQCKLHSGYTAASGPGRHAIICYIGSLDRNKSRRSGVPGTPTKDTDGKRDILINGTLRSDKRTGITVVNTKWILIATLPLPIVYRQGRTVWTLGEWAKKNKKKIKISQWQKTAHVGFTAFRRPHGRTHIHYITILHVS